MSATPPAPPAKAMPASIRPALRVDLIGEAIKLYSEKAGVWLVATLPLLVVSLAYSVLYNGTNTLREVLTHRGYHPLGLIVAQVVLVLLDLVAVSVFSAGLTRLAVKQVKGEPIAAVDAFDIRKDISTILTASLLQIPAFLVAFCACIVPGVFLQALWILTYPLIVDRGMSARHALSTSFRVLRRHLWAVTGIVFLVNLSMLVIGATCFGLLLSMPIISLVYALIYREAYLRPMAAFEHAEAAPPA